MSFLGDLWDAGSKALGISKNTSNLIASGAKAASLALMLKQVTHSSKKKKDTPRAATYDAPDYGVREQVDPDTDTYIPIVYGEAFLGGNITDAVLSDDKQTMWYCLAICEQTGVKLSDNQQSVISFEELYWNQYRVYLKSDGTTVAYLKDDDGNKSDDMAGLVNFYFYSSGSDNPVGLKGYTNPHILATGLFPNWKPTHSMENIVFCIVKVKYNKPMGVTGLGNIEFKMKNTMTQPAHHDRDQRYWTWNSARGH